MYITTLPLSVSVSAKRYAKGEIRPIHRNAWDPSGIPFEPTVTHRGRRVGVIIKTSWSPRDSIFEISTFVRLVCQA